MDSDYFDSHWELEQYRGRVANTIKGKRSQKFIKDLISALDILPEKKLISNALESSGQFCAIGSVGRARGIQMSEINPEDCDSIAKIFDISPTLAREISYENDETGSVNPENRWLRMRAWAVRNLKIKEIAMKAR
jgi:hypothetical protein